VHDSGGNLSISNSTISYSGTEGIYLDDTGAGPSTLTISDCLIEHNSTYGIYCLNTGNHVINECVIRNNVTGFYSNYGSQQFLDNNRIYGHSGRGILLSSSAAPVFGSTADQWNDIYDNGEYNLYNGTADITAHYVWWGSTDPGVIEASIYHENDDPALGLVGYTPWLDEGHGVGYVTAPANLNISVEDEIVTLTWDPVAEATSYVVYSSSGAYGGYVEDLSGAYDGTSWSAPLSGDLRFYEVTAVAE